MLFYGSIAPGGLCVYFGSIIGFVEKSYGETMVQYLDSYGEVRATHLGAFHRIVCPD